MKPLISLVILLFLGSFLCFYHPSAYFDWVLFLLLFGLTVLGIVSFVKPDLLLKKRRRLNEQVEQSVLADLHEGVIIFDKKGKILQINRKSEKILGVAPNRLSAHSFFDFHPENNKQIFLKSCALMKKCIEDNTPQSFSFCSKDGKKLQDLFVKPLAQKDHYLLLLHDSSSQYKIQQIGKDFIANASHELRTPITIIKGFAETLNDLPQISDVMLEDFIEKIMRNCERMDNLVKSLLILTDLENLPETRLQECDLVAFVDNCIHTLLAVHPNIDIEALHNKDIITILADPDLLELALMNLLENAVKYSKGEPKIAITIEELSGEVLLSIADKGMGIPKEDLDHICERFYTVNKAHSRRLGGAGLGLSIVNMIAKKHGATMSVSSKVDEGSTFTFTFGGFLEKAPLAPQ